MISKFPSSVEWEKNMGKFSIKVHKTWNALGKGLSLVVGCSTFPVWNSVTGIYASLVTGNPVIVKPHPAGILSIAIVVAEIQKVLVENGFSSHLLQFAADEISNPITKQLAEHKDVKLIDYTGSSHFGDYLESLPNKTTFTEKAGVNSVIIDSVKDMNAVAQNLAFAASLYSGQMCTAPQNIFIPERGIQSGENHLSFDDVQNSLVDAIKGIATHPKMGPGILGAIQNINTSNRVTDLEAKGYNVLLSSHSIVNEEFEGARTASPIVIFLDATQKNDFSDELFGPIVFIIKTKDTNQSINLAKDLALSKGAISCGAYTTNDEVKSMIASEMEEAYVPVAFNMTGQIFMNQNAAFSDFHVTGGNPAGNASFTDQSYIAKRFVWVGHKEVIE
jgi:phenylacetic acid degradation protein paaN